MSLFQRVLLEPVPEDPAFRCGSTTDAIVRAECRPMTLKTVLPVNIFIYLVLYLAIHSFVFGKKKQTFGVNCFRLIEQCPVVWSSVHFWTLEGGITNTVVLYCIVLLYPKVQALSIAAARIWNSLPVSIGSANSLLLSVRVANAPLVSVRSANSLLVFVCSDKFLSVSVRSDNSLPVSSVRSAQ